MTESVVVKATQCERASVVLETMSLQPYFTFRAEATRLNQLYWTSRYSLRCLAQLAATEVSDLPAPTTDEKKNRAQSPSQERILESLRVAAVLHVCSAFEHALVSYFALCLLYRPAAYSKTKNFQPLPLLLTKASKLQDARSQAQSTADGQMEGSYATRLGLFGTKFGIDVSWSDPKLDEHYATRHKVAHDQALDGADDPALSSAEVIAKLTPLSETEWKAMLGVFTKTVYRLDAEVAASVVTDHGLSLAVHRTIERNPKAEYDDVFRAVLDEWRIPAKHRSKGAILQLMGLVKQGRGK